MILKPKDSLAILFDFSEIIGIEIEKLKILLAIDRSST